MKEIIEAIEALTSEVSELNVDKTNDFGYTVGDELHEMNFYLKEIMEAIQKIANK
jgi:hypothetical protein